MKGSGFGGVMIAGNISVIVDYCLKVAHVTKTGTAEYSKLLYTVPDHGFI